MVETPDPDKIFDDIISGLNIETPNFDFSGWSDRQLMVRFFEIRQQTLEQGRLLMPETEEQRDLLMERGALLLEIKARGIWRDK